jgi:Tfp pilus assembly protein PilN
MQKILGVNIDSGSLGVSLMDSGIRSVKQLKSERTVLPATGDERNSVIAETLAGWQKTYKPAGSVIGLPLQYFSWRTIEMISMKRADMQKALFYELEKYLPLPMDEYIFDFMITGSGKTDPNMVRVLVLSIKREVLDEILKTVKEAGLDVLSVRCSTTDILGGAMEISGEKKMSGIFLNSSDEAYEIVALQDSMPVFLKRVPKADDIAEEISILSVQYPGRLYITGPLDQSAAGKFNGRKIQVSVPDLLVSSYKKNKNFDLNFIPEEFIKEKKDYYPQIIGGLAAAAIILFLATGTLTYFKDRRALAVVEARISDIESRASGILEAQKKLDLLQSDRSALLDFQNKSNLPIKVLTILSRKMPADAWLVTISVDDKGKVEMEGFSTGTADFVVALEKSKAFKNIMFSAPIITKDKEERFALKMEVEAFE